MSLLDDYCPICGEPFSGELAVAGLLRDEFGNLVPQHRCDPAWLERYDRRMSNDNDVPPRRSYGERLSTGMQMLGQDGDYTELNDY